MSKYCPQYLDFFKYELEENLAYVKLAESYRILGEDYVRKNFTPKTLKEALKTKEGENKVFTNILEHIKNCEKDIDYLLLKH